MSNVLTAALIKNQSEVKAAIESAPDWKLAIDHFDALYQCMSDPNNTLWSKATINKLHTTFYKARDEDRDCTNITERTVKAMPEPKANDIKKIFLQIASTCRIFHAAHKVNFEAAEVPKSFPEIPMVKGKRKGMFTYAATMPTLYPKISLTFDYWVPKILDWTKEIRSKGLTEWRGEATMNHESCTDFMRISLMFLSDTKNNLPIAKWNVREALLEKCFGEKFIWIRKSAKQEDILANSKALKYHLQGLSQEIGYKIPTEAWSRILQLQPVKSMLT